MQPPTAGPRSGLTEDQVVALIQDSPALTVNGGLELVDLNMEVVEDISDDLLDGSITRESSATLHGTAALEISRDLDWANAIVRPYVTLTDGTTSARFNMGAYLTNVPSVRFGSFPNTQTVQGYDILHWLNTSVGEAYVVSTGTAYLTAVESVLIGRGILAYSIDQEKAGVVLPSNRVWPLDERTTWLNVVNDLLGAIGYLGIWSDWDGRLRCVPYENPRERAPEWTYHDDELKSMMAPTGNVERDYFDVPNRWVAVRSNDIDGATPTEGNGVYTYTNERTGPTSVEGRNGRIITQFMSVEAADQTSLIAKVNAAVDAAITITMAIDVDTAPNPLHWHFDRLYVANDSLPMMDVLSTKWTMSLTGNPMSHRWLALT
jgi:hypothetical protein